MASEQAQRRETAIQGLQRIRMSPHRHGWSETGWELAREAARPGFDARVQAEAAALLTGMDAQLIKLLPEEPETLAFNPSGRLVVSGADAMLRVWDPRNDEVRTVETNAGGLVGFPADGGAVQLVTCDVDDSTLLLFNVESGGLVRGFPGPVEGDSHTVATTLTSDGSRLAASIRTPDPKQDIVAVWDATGPSTPAPALRRAAD